MLKKIKKSNCDKIQKLELRQILIHEEHFDTLTNDEIFSGQRFAILQCLMVISISMSMSIIIPISFFSYISISIINIKLVFKFVGREKPELIGSVLKLFIAYESYGWQLESQILNSKGTNRISQWRLSLGNGISNWFLGF